MLVSIFVFIPYLRLHIVFSYIKQLQLQATNSNKISLHFILLQILYISLLWLISYTHHLKVDI